MEREATVYIVDNKLVVEDLEIEHQYIEVDIERIIDLINEYGIAKVHHESETIQVFGKTFAFEEFWNSVKNKENVYEKYNITEGQKERLLEIIQEWKVENEKINSNLY